MILGVATFIFGIYLYTSDNNVIAVQTGNTTLDNIIDMALADGVLTDNERKLIRQSAEEHGLDYSIIIKQIEIRISSMDGKSETEIIDQNLKNGLDFEKYIARKFDPSFFSIKDWTGDKYVDGVYAKTTQNPDMLIEINIGKQSAQFYVECKWRKNYYRNGIELAKLEQLQRYQVFQKDKGIPVFILLGVGGTGANPNSIYVIPVSQLSKNFLNITELNIYEKIIESNFFFDLNTNNLR